MAIRTFLLALLIFSVFVPKAQQPGEIEQYAVNKKIPLSIRQQVLKALSFFPELAHTTIHFTWKPNIKTSVMQAQPKLLSLFGKKKDRRYNIYIRKRVQLVDGTIPIEEVPEQELVGWLGHELGHIADYQTKSNTAMVTFGLQYLLSKGFVKQAEASADTYAVEHGLANQLVATKRYILNNAAMPAAYKHKIRRLYLSPDEIEKIVNIQEGQTRWELVKTQ